MRKIFLLSTAFIITSVAAAQNSNRLLDWPMKLKTVSIKTDADAFTVTSFIEMEFCNPNNEEIEGLYRFRLEPGQAITNFQLDLNGKFRDGSIEEKWKANNAYNRIVGKRVDPAILNLEYQNNYSIRIYPVPAHGCRRITMTIQQQLRKERDEYYFKLPVTIPNDSVSLSANINVRGAAGFPYASEGMLKGSSFAALNDKYNLVISKLLSRGDNQIVFSIPADMQQPVVCTKTINEKTFFAIRFRPQIPKGVKLNLNKIAVWWDFSNSAARRDQGKELKFLDDFIKTNKVKTVFIYPFNFKLIDSAVFQITNTKNDKWKEYLQSFKKEGATDFGVINFSSPAADVNFLFSDGMQTYSTNEPELSPAPLNCVHAASAYDSIFFRKLIASTGGRYIDLNKTYVPVAVQIASNTENTLLKIEGSGSQVHLHQSINNLQKEEIFVTGYFTGDVDSIRFHYGNNLIPGSVQSVYAGKNTACSESAIDRLNMLSVFEQEIQQYDWYKQLEFGKSERVVTYRTSYIVLERIEDYIRYNIMPPKELEAECDMNQFVKNDERMRNEFKRASNEQILTNVATVYNKRIEWNGKNISHIKLVPEDFAVNKPEAKSVEAQKENKSAFIPDKTTESETGDGAMREVVVTTALGVKKRPKEIGYSVSTVKYDNISTTRSFTFGHALSGKVAGLTVYNTGNAVVPDARIVLRGNRSISGENQALIVLDGVPVPNSIMGYLNPSDIESVTILKGVQAAGLYGSEAVNGAILISMKKSIGRYYGYYNRGAYKLKHMEDVDYINEIKTATRSDRLSMYEQLKEQYGYDPKFYIDMAVYLSAAGFRYEAINVLTSAADISKYDKTVVQAIAFVLEEMKEYEEAIRVYSQLLKNNENDISLHRDLAFTYYQKGDYQQAVNILYDAIKKNYEESETYLVSQKAAMLEEMNAIIVAHKDSIDISGIQPKLLVPLEADIRITISYNKYSGRDLKLTGAGVRKANRKDDGNETGSSQYYPFGYNSFRTGNEFEIKNAVKGKYGIRISYYDYYDPYYASVATTPSMAKIMVIKNFGRPGQTITIQNVMLNNQGGEFEIGEVNW
jgi:TonB-dependent SusC/RagA subfamily outer membrane receptor